MLIARVYSLAATPAEKHELSIAHIELPDVIPADVIGDARQRGQIDRKPVTGRCQKATRIALQEGALVEARITLARLKKADSVHEWLTDKKRLLLRERLNKESVWKWRGNLYERVEEKHF